jgi:hypothetical protein
LSSITPSLDQQQQKMTFLNDEKIESEIQKLEEINKYGKRLWHEKNKINFNWEKSSKNYYQLLKCFSYDPKPNESVLPNVLIKNK